MKSFFILGISFLLCQMTVYAQQKPSFEKLDAGVSDQYIVSLGTGADSFFSQRLSDPSAQKYLSATISHLRWKQDGSPRVNSEVSSALEQFVSSGIYHEGKISNELLESLSQALEVIGERGGPEAIAYLTDWATTDKFVRSVRCFGKGSSIEKTADRLRRHAVIGLGLSGSQQAMSTLQDLAKNPPKSIYPGSMKGVLNRAMSENTAIRRDGEEAFFRGSKFKPESPQ